MQFNSITFILFFSIISILHNLQSDWRKKKLQLLCASYLFYSAWNPPFVILLWVSTAVDWLVGKRLCEVKSVRKRKCLVLVSLFVNLGLLGFFKYSGFLLENFKTVLDLMGVSFVPIRLDVILPVGISFYTFQTLSYTLDIYRKKIRQSRSFLDYALYVTFFPQLAAGPIVRASVFLPQCFVDRRITFQRFSRGIYLLILGLFEKVVLADGILGPIADRIFSERVNPDSISAWCGTLAFSGQIFFDFAGYSTCAIGIAKCLGFNLPNNFCYPYAAIGFSDFWRRWHISLSTWLRDYLYIPLGGNRVGNLRKNLNLMLTMLIGGLWHGACWKFVCWGGLHGIFLCIEKELSARFATSSIRYIPGVNLILGLGTFIVVCFTWVFFRAESLGHALLILNAMLGQVSDEHQFTINRSDMFLVIVVISSMLIIQCILRERCPGGIIERIPWWLRSGLVATMLISLITVSGRGQNFVYFQF